MLDKTPGRRAVLAGIGAALVAPGALRAEDAYPNRPIKFIVPYTPAGATDNLSRIDMAKVAELLGQQILIDNRAGGGGSIGTDAIAKAVPDGYTIGLITISMHTIAPTLYEKLPYDPVKDFTPIGGIAVWPNMLVVNPSLPAKTVPELIALLKANPGKYNMASSGSGTTIHLAGEMFKQMTGTDMVHVPYKGSAPARSASPGPPATRPPPTCRPSPSSCQVTRSRSGWAMAVRPACPRQLSRSSPWLARKPWKTLESLLNLPNWVPIPGP
jgi:tripartite-type tricarboxylate transporter receptor subunit TctC